MVQIRITSKKREKMSEHAEKALKHMGKLMQCIEELGDDDMDERYGSGRYGSGGGSMGERYHMERGRMNGRDDWEDDDDDERMPQMGERRRRASNGRYA